MENDGIDRENGEGNTTEGYAPPQERYSATKDSFTIGEVVERLRPEFPALSVSKIRYLERRRLINLSRTRGGYRIRDVGSLNGTYVNRVRVDAVDLRNGDEIQVGKYRFRFVFS